MINTKLLSKLILYVFFINMLFFDLSAKINQNFKRNNSITNYLSGVILSNNNEYLNSYNYLKKLQGLEDSHPEFAMKYLNSLVYLGKINESYIFSKKLNKKKLNTYESLIILTIYNLKRKNFTSSLEYLNIMDNLASMSPAQILLVDYLKLWTEVGLSKINNIYAMEKNLSNIQKNFQNISKIQKAMFNAFFQSKKTEKSFEDLLNKNDTDFSRYIYFYAKYLNETGQKIKSLEILNKGLDKKPRNLLLNQYFIDLKENKKIPVEKFEFKNISHNVAELFYLLSNAYSAQLMLDKSNFYLNISRYLNPDFISIKNLLAENLFIDQNFEEAIKIYKDIAKSSELYNWHASKQISKIYLNKDNVKKSIEYLKKEYDKIDKPNKYQIFDYAEFLKNNEQFELSIYYYTEVLKNLNSEEDLYYKSKEGRGVSFERISKWKKAEKDLLDSIKAKSDQAYVLNYLAYTWVDKGINLERSLEMLKQANNLRNNDGYIIDSLGWAFFKLKNYEKSKNLLQKAIILMPTDPIVNDHYGDVLWAVGQKIQARYYWNYVLNSEKTEKELLDKVKKKLSSNSQVF